MPQVTPTAQWLTSEAMARRATGRRVYAQDRSGVRTAVEAVVGALGLRLEDAAGEWEVRARRGVSLMTWGERIQIVTATNPGGGTQVVVESRLTFGLIDWGRNQSNVDEILAALDERLDQVPGGG